MTRVHARYSTAAGQLLVTSTPLNEALIEPTDYKPRWRHRDTPDRCHLSGCHTLKINLQHVYAWPQLRDDDGRMADGLGKESTFIRDCTTCIIEDCAMALNTRCWPILTCAQMDQNCVRSILLGVKIRAISWPNLKIFVRALGIKLVHVTIIKIHKPLLVPTSIKLETHWIWNHQITYQNGNQHRIDFEFILEM